MMPFYQPPWEYKTHGPWLVTFEWADGTILTTKEKELKNAVYRFWDSLKLWPNIGEPETPNRRVIVDARGITILGCLVGVPSDCPVVATEEIHSMQEKMGVNPVDMVELEMEIRWNIESAK